ncbi:MAG TPA: VTC domain-containing protein [Vicinamibacterales bacterium]|nr:VTC domain-containing protein [Vicinamibacterales bacterium]
MPILPGASDAAQAAAPHGPVLSASPDPLERELKFVVPPSRTAFVGAWLRSVCLPDPVHPPARVVTVYFDTPQLELLYEKINSDYLKTKVRVRWYERLDGSPAGEAVFVEAKHRVGSTRAKTRRTADTTASEVAGWSLQRREWPTLLDVLRGAGIEVPQGLAPAIRLSYVRERLTDRVEGGRLNLDTVMHVDAVNPERIRPGVTGPMPGAVVEYKGRTPDLPDHLRLLPRSGGRRASFSKYLAGYLYAARTVL